jgi:hypothetical protein
MSDDFNRAVFDRAVSSAYSDSNCGNNYNSPQRQKRLSNEPGNYLSDWRISRIAQ